MAICLVTDSASDINETIARDYNIKVVPLTVHFGDQHHYKDREEIDSKKFFEYLESFDVHPHTAQVNPLVFEACFREIVDQGDEVVGIFLSAEMSGTYNSAMMAKNALEEQADRVTIIDSKMVTLGQALIVYEAAKLIREGKDRSTVERMIEEKIEKVESAIVVDTLEYLKKGGRLSAGEAFIGSVLKLKPILQLKDGKLIPKGKVRGRKKAIKWIKEWLDENQFDLSDKTVAFAHAEEEEYLQALKELIQKQYRPKETIDCRVGGVVGTHSGPGAIALCFVND